MYDAFFKKLDCRSKAAALFYKVTGSNGWICIMECKVLFILQVNCAALSAAVPVGFFFSFLHLQPITFCMCSLVFVGLITRML